MSRRGSAWAAISLTRRGWSLVGAALGLVVGSFLLGAIEMLAVGVAAFLVIGAMVMWLALSPRPELAISRRVRPSRLHVGSEGRIDLTVENVGPRPTSVLAATDWFDEGRRAARFLVPPLPPGGIGRAAYRIPTRRRGRYQVGPLSVRARDPFALAQRALQGADIADLVIRPRVHDIVAPVAAGGRVATGEHALGARAMVSDLGDEFLTLRPYEVGDELRRVHWKSTARTGDLMIRQDEARWRAHAAVVLDVRAAAHNTESFEIAVEAAASVTARLVRLRRRVEVITSAGELLGIGGDPRHDVIDQLATVGPDEPDRLAAVFENLRAHRRVDLVVAILGDISGPGLRALGALAGIGVVVVLTRPATISSSSALVVDASATPFATAWNHVLTAATAAGSRAEAWQRARASSHQ